MKATTKKALWVFGAGSLMGLALGVWLCWPAPCKCHRLEVETVTAGVREMNKSTDRWMAELEKELTK